MHYCFLPVYVIVSVGLCLDFKFFKEKNCTLVIATLVIVPLEPSIVPVIQKTFNNYGREEKSEIWGGK